MPFKAIATMKKVRWKYDYQIFINHLAYSSSDDGCDAYGNSLNNNVEVGTNGENNQNGGEDINDEYGVDGNAADEGGAGDEDSMPELDYLSEYSQ